MRKAWGLAAIVALLGVTSGSAIAQSPSGAANRGLYIEGAGGINWLDDTDGFYRLRADHPIPALRNMEFPSTTSYDTGWGISGRLGYAWASGLRVDGEIAYRRNEVDKSTFLATDGTNFFNLTDENPSGHARSVALMANAYYDFINSTGITPYIGGGLGVVNVGGTYTASVSPFTLRADTIHDSDWGFAAQAIGGVSIALSRSLSLVADYRYMKAYDISTFQVQADAPALPDQAAASLGGRGDYENHTVMVGLRYSFDNDRPSLK